MAAAEMIALGYPACAELPAEYKHSRVVMLVDPDVRWDFPMRWNPRGHNIVFQRTKVGIWEDDGGGMTWSEEHPDGAPGWWKSPEEALT